MRDSAFQERKGESMWKDIKGYEGHYQVSDDGRVRSLKSKEPLVMKPHPAGRGYETVCLCKNGNAKHAYIHRLVAEIFLENPENKPTVNHKDGNRLNNHVDNLEFMTYSENNQHAYDHEIHDRGERHYRARLTETDVAYIKAQGKFTTFQKIADQFGVSKATIRDILVGKTWKAVDPA